MTTAAAPARPAAKLVPLRRNRDFQRLWVGQVVSTLGTRISSIAYPLLVLARTGSPAKAGIVGLAAGLPFLVWYLPAGALVDRWDRRRVMLGADAGRALALGSIAVALAVHHLTYVQLLVVAFVEGSLFVFFNLAETAALPHVVPAPQLPDALAANEARNQGADVAGVPLGGWLFGIDPLAPFAVDAVSYVVSFASVASIRRSFQLERAAKTASKLRSDIALGVRWLWHQHFLRAAVVMVGGANFVFNALTLVIIVRARDLGASAAVVGAVLAGAGAGGIAGALLAPRLQRWLGARVLLLGVMWFWAVLMLVLPAVHSLPAVGVLYGALSLPGPAFNVSLSTYRYALVPDELMARVRSVSAVVGWGTIPLGSLAAGLLAQGLGADRALLVIAAVMALVTVSFTVTRVIRQAPSIDELLLTPPSPPG